MLRIFSLKILLTFIKKTHPRLAHESCLQERHGPLQRTAAGYETHGYLAQCACRAVAWWQAIATGTATGLRHSSTRRRDHRKAQIRDR